MAWRAAGVHASLQMPSTLRAYSSHSGSQAVLVSCDTTSTTLHPTFTASIVADHDHSNWVRESEDWSERLPICIITTTSPMGDKAPESHLRSPPGMATGEADAVPRVGSKWSGRWAGCGKITARGVSHRSGRIFCRSVDLLTTSLLSIFHQTIVSFVCALFRSHSYRNLCPRVALLTCDAVSVQPPR